MAYNLYQAQMAKAWAQRIEKEQLVAERFWAQQMTKPDYDQTPFYSGSGLSMQPYGNIKDIETCSSIAPTYVSDLTEESVSTELLRNRLVELEAELTLERELRAKLEEDLKSIKSSLKK